MEGSLKYDYYYGEEAEQFSFFRVPKLLIKDKRFKGLSSDAKLLYGLMLDRMALSIKNGWFDDANRAYIIYTKEAIIEDLGCGATTCTKLTTELKEIGLIEKKRQGQGKPDIIYVKNFVVVENKTEADISAEVQNMNIKDSCSPISRSSEVEHQEMQVENLQIFSKQFSRNSKNEFVEVQKSDANNNNTNHTDFSKTDSINLSNDDVEIDRVSEGIIFEDMVLLEMKNNIGIPVSYAKERQKMKTGIYHFVDWNTYSVYEDYTDYEQSVHNLIIESLIEMATEQDVQKYANCKVSNKQVIEQINKIIRAKADQICPLHFFVEMVMDDFIKAASVTEIKNHKGYIKSCIWSAFDSYKVKWHSDFERTYNLALLSKCELM